METEERMTRLKSLEADRDRTLEALEKITDILESNGKDRENRTLQERVKYLEMKIQDFEHALNINCNLWERRQENEFEEASLEKIRSLIRKSKSTK